MTEAASHSSAVTSSREVSLEAEVRAFEVEHVSYHYHQGRAPAVVDVSFEVRAGQRVVVLGANGSGKSTLLKILDGLYFPSSGAVRAFGQEITPESLADDEVNWAFRRRVGLVFQDPDVQLFSPTVWDDVAFGPLQLGLPRQEVIDRVQATLALLGIESLADRVPYGLSGGEKKKVALASALVLDPQALLMDEPTAALDPRSQRVLVDLILEFGAKGRTIVTATHDLDVAAEIADHVLVMGEDKRLVRAGPPHEILSDHALLEANNLAHSHRHVHYVGAPGASRSASEVADSAEDAQDAQDAHDAHEVHSHPHLHHDLHGHQLRG